MAVDFPFTDPAFCVVQIQWGASPQTLAVESVINGGIQTQGTPWKKWTPSIVLQRTTNPAYQARREAWLDALNGQAVRVNIWNFSRVGLGGRGYPMGTINTSGLQVNANTAQFATSIGLKNCGNLKTLEDGDMVKVGDQLIMTPYGGAVADGSGILTLPVTGGLIAAAAVNASVTVIKPTVQCVLANPDWRSTYNPGVAEGMAIDFMEAR